MIFHPHFTRSAWRGALSRTLMHLLALLALALALPAHAAIPASERTVLTNLFTSTNGAGWTNKTNWNGAVGTECTWFGVTCNGGLTNVTGIFLNNNNLTGPLPAISALSALTAFSVGVNQLTGSIPSLSGLNALKTVTLNSNQLTGSPPDLTGLSALQSFLASANALTGSIPAFGGLPALMSYDVSANQLSGSIPPLSALSALTNVFLYQNQLTGNLPDLAGLSALQVFNARNNLLSGTIPAFSGLPALKTFTVNTNNLSGSVPALTGLSALTVFDVKGNGLTGNLPPLTGLLALKTFTADNNQLTGSIPALSGLIALEIFNVQNNQLSGSMPSLTGLTALANFNVANNQLTGSIPILTGLTALDTFRASNNQLTGNIPALAALGALLDFRVDQNTLTGTIPSLTGLANLQIFNVGKNQLSGAIPGLNGLSALAVFVVSNNQLSGNIPAVPSPTNALIAGGSALCPNQLTASVNAAWDAATGSVPWSALCNAVAVIPTVSISDAFLTEGNVGTSVMNFTVTLDVPAPVGGVTITYSTAPGTATAGSDYVSVVAGSVTIAQGEIAGNLPITINGDTTVEPDETFTVTIGSVTNATIGTATATGTIQNDDAVVLPVLTLSNASKMEGNAGTSVLNFPLALNGPAPVGGVIITYSTADVTATAGSDYVAVVAGTVTIPAGATMGSLPVTINGDTTVEGDETFTVTMTNVVNATISGTVAPQSTATGTIVNDDVVSVMPVVSVGNASLLEGNAGTQVLNFPVMLVGAAPVGGLTITYSTANGTATAGSDYVAVVAGTVTIAQGATTGNLPVTINGDTTVEPDEMFTVTISTVTNATIGTGTATGTILNDDVFVPPVVVAATPVPVDSPWALLAVMLGVIGFALRERRAAETRSAT